MNRKQKITLFNSTLFRWHRKNYRPMAWRDTRDPYEILVSEIMLQQTQVVRVRDKYTSFLRRFPTVRSLASAPLGDVLREWSGLGYNRRAKYLHECAKRITGQFDGTFPRERDLLLKLPGIGPSTASAIRSFAFNEDDPMIDTNIRRVLTRVFFSSRGARGKKAKIARTIPDDKILYALACTLIPRGEGRRWNYAMLDLAATRCTAKNHSDQCPFMDWHGAIEEPIQRTRSPFRDTRRYARGKVLRAITRHPEGVRTGAVAEELRGTRFLAKEILKTLLDDGLIQRKKSMYVLPERM
jgi:A/G-specific adenine glycosylase